MLLTLGMLVVALFQVTGRITFALLDDLELAVNQVLSARGMRVTGLSGDWRMLNPILRVDRLDLPAGTVRGLVLEVDMADTVLHGRLLARRLKVEGAHLTVEKTPDEPWRLAGAGAPGAFDPLPFLAASGQLEVAATLRLVREGQPPAELIVDYLGINRGGEQRHAVTVANAAGDCLGACRLALDLQAEEGLWPLRPGRLRVTAASNGFLLPRALLGISPLRIAELDLNWQRQRGESGGALSLAVEQFDMPGDVTLAARLRGVTRGSGDIHRGAVTTWEIRRADEVWTLPQVTISADPEGATAWLPELDLERAGQFLRQALAGIEPAERWLGGLNVRGRAHNVRAFYAVDGGIGYALTVDGLALDGFKGVPMVRNASGELLGYRRGLQLHLNAQDMDIAFPEIFTGQWRLPYAQGVLQAWFGRNYFGIRGTHLRADAFGSRAAGGFAMTRPPDREGQRLTLMVATPRISVDDARQFVPYRLPEALRGWLAEAPRSGMLQNVRLAYQGQFQEEPGELARRVELTARVRDGNVRYHQDWPAVTELDAGLTVAGSVVDVAVNAARSGGAALGGTRLRVVDNGAAVDVSLDADTLGADALTFIRTTPLAQWLGFVEPSWDSRGPLRLSGELHVPLGAAAHELAVRLRADLDGVDLDMPGYRLALSDLAGSFRYRYPFEVDASNVRGVLFDEPVTLGARSDRQRVHILIDGQARPADLWQIIDVPDPGLARGTFPYQADLAVAVSDERVTELTVSSSLEGLALTLPAGYGKAEDAAEPLDVVLEFHPEQQTVRFRYRDSRGWVDVADTPQRGMVAFGAAPPLAVEPPLAADAVLPEAGEMVLIGRLAGFELDEVLPGEGDGLGLPLALRLDRLAVGRIGIGDFTVNRAVLNGRVDGDGFDLALESDEVSGTLALAGAAPLQVNLGRLAVPVAAGGGDPLAPELIADLPAADVWVERLLLGDEDYGSWSGRIRPEDGNLRVEGLEAQVKGVAVQADELVWRGGPNETHFAGTLTAQNLADVLPQWEYAPTLETESASLAGAFTWPGSPAAVDLLILNGQATAAARDGRFLEVESDALRIFSLLNFTAIAKRMSLNFADVFGRGVSFDSLDTAFSLNDGQLRFVEPLAVEGTGSAFRVSGRVDLKEKRLDNEMIVTLPVSRSLPWYAAYVALANPLAGIAVLAGERVLRKPLEQFSSAKYRIGGTLDDPEVKFVSVFDVAPPESQQDNPSSDSQESHE